MESRSTSKQVTFRRPFTLSGLDSILSPGTYVVRIEEEMLDTVTFVGWRQTCCTMELRRDGGVEYAAIDPQDLREALLLDDQGTDPSARPAVVQRSSAARQLRRGGRQ